ncbi:hypothetical protein ACROYT_G012867 [Oculina patagonica]
MANFVESDTCDASDAYIKQEAMNAMKRCNSRIKDCYDDHDDDEHDKETLYCHGMKILYALIGTLLGLCTYDDFQENLDHLKQKTDNVPEFKDKNIFYTNIPDNSAKSCARQIHDQCTPYLVARNPDGDLCSSVKEFLLCYKDKVTNVPAGCDEAPDISKDFNTIIQKFSNDLIDMYRGDPSMCTVDQSALVGEADCFD